MKILLTILAVVLPACLALPVDDVNDERVVGGRPANRGQFPHQLSLQINGQHSCGASLISDSIALTAAHCIYGVSGQMFAVAGITDLTDPGIRVAVAQAVMHAQYDPIKVKNDIAILRLAQRLPIGGVVQLVRLRGQRVEPGETLTLSGWGRTSFPGNIPRIMQWINLRGIALNICKQAMPSSTPITDGNVCTGAPHGQGACQGDSGGPLIDAHHQQIGVVSWGIPCARGYPDVFTSVPYYMNWILQSMMMLENQTMYDARPLK